MHTILTDEVAWMVVLGRAARNGSGVAGTCAHAQDRSERSSCVRSVSFIGWVCIFKAVSILQSGLVVIVQETNAIGSANVGAATQPNPLIYVRCGI
jgi:hypothetical protein